MQEGLFYDKFSTKLCYVILVGNEFGLKYLHLITPENKDKIKILDDWIKNPDFFVNLKSQILQYFAGERKKFDNIKLNLDGTEFQKKVWRQLQNIAYGETKTYKQIAKEIGNNKASRAVGMANNKNPIPLIIPCHRVIGSNGKLVGFGPGLELKQNLLNLENNK